MTEKEYRQHPAISRSELWKISESPEKFKYYREHPQEPTPSLIFGQLFHKLALEPYSFDDEFVICPNIDRRTKAGKAEWDEFIQSVDDRTVIDIASYEKAAEMVRALYSEPLVRKLLNGECEKPFFWVDEMTGEECKCRVDCLTEIKNSPPIIVDLKTTSNAQTDEFIRSAIKYGYDFQSAMYSDGVKANIGKDVSFVFIAVEKEPPYSVNILQADELIIRRGYDIFRELIGIYHECKQSGEWYGYLGKYNTVNNLSLPPWLAKEFE